MLDIALSNEEAVGRIVMGEMCTDINTYIRDRTDRNQFYVRHISTFAWFYPDPQWSVYDYQTSKKLAKISRTRQSKTPWWSTYVSGEQYDIEMCGNPYETTPLDKFLMLCYCMSNWMKKRGNYKMLRGMDPAPTSVNDNELKQQDLHIRAENLKNEHIAKSSIR